MKPEMKFPYGYKGIVFLGKDGKPRPVGRKRKEDRHCSEPPKSGQAQVPVPISTTVEQETNTNPAITDPTVQSLQYFTATISAHGEGQNTEYPPVTESIGKASEEPSSNWTSVTAWSNRILALGSTFRGSQGSIPVDKQKELPSADDQMQNTSTTFRQGVELDDIDSIQHWNASNAITAVDCSGAINVFDTTQENCGKEPASDPQKSVSGYPTALDPENNIWAVDKLLKKRGKGKKAKYLVKWHGFGNEANSWSKRGDINPELVKDFEASLRTQKQARTPGRGRQRRRGRNG